MPNTCITRVLIVMKYEFKVLYNEILKNKLVITYINEANICFRRGMLFSSIDIVKVFIDIGIANFSILGILTSVFLCLKDIDIYGILLNNIIN